ncbi:MBL fold metallo-hydrolase [Maricaulis sp.]|uniref:MBL fold metallo-hydrolase n=1 Tax=Maricaulis sp. TaxID=1486257 RepID=UPI0026093C3C|nr:MBL fold metallo-hydrolase [Maricaulis sp.]MDF1770011.1 MBL fold metallo-hydrolase [Maricaulis sp.]
MMRFPGSALRLATALCASTCASTLSAAPAFAHPSEDDPATAHFLANEAILVSAGETRILFDPLFSVSYGYPLVAPDVRAAIMAGTPPYDGVDAVFVSHVHGDHFDAAAVNAYLAAHPDVILVGPWQARLDMQAADGWDAAFEARIHALPFIASPQELVLAADGVEDAIRVETVHIPHAGGPGRAGIQNMAHRVTLNGAATVMHLGDATPEPAIYDTHSDHFAARTTQHAFPPYWLLGQWGGETVRQRLNADAATGIHIPIAQPGWLEESGEDFFTEAGETRSIPDHSHD